MPASVVMVDAGVRGGGDGGNGGGDGSLPRIKTPEYGCSSRAMRTTQVFRLNILRSGKTFYAVAYLRSKEHDQGEPCNASQTHLIIPIHHPSAT